MCDVSLCFCLFSGQVCNLIALISVQSRKFQRGGGAFSFDLRFLQISQITLCYRWPTPALARGHLIKKGANGPL